MNRNHTLGLIAAVVGLVIVPVARADQPTSKIPTATVRVGTFDSRAVAMAHFGKMIEDGWLENLYAEHAEAMSTGDKKRAAELEAKGQGRQRQLHRQVFGTGSVQEALAEIKELIPKVASSSRVDMVICTHDIAFCSPSVELVDVTDRMVNLFKPDEETLEKIQALLKHPPFPDEVIDTMECQSPGQK